MVSVITKMVPIKYYVVDGIEFAANELLQLLEKITDEGKASELDLDYNCAEKLVELGCLVKQYGYHQITIYCDTEDKKAAKLFNEIVNLK